MAAKNTTAEARESSKTEGTQAQADTRKVCGIVMPISPIGDEYSEEHWRRVRKIHQRAIERAGMRAQLVWENPEVDVIQTAILQNLYENDVVVCDLSGLNPNVMLETGLRLSTKRPTVIVTDRAQKPPFDVSTIGYIDYQRDLEYNAIEDFIERLRRKITDVSRAYEEGKYQSFVENFTFEIVTPTSVNVTADQYIKERIDDLAIALSRIERNQRERALPVPRGQRAKSPSPSTHQSRASEIGKFNVELSPGLAKEAESLIDDIYGVYCMVKKISENRFEFVINIMDYARSDEQEAITKVSDILRQIGSQYERKI